MSSKVQIRRGTTSSANAFLGAEGELYANLDQNDIRVHDGVTVGGHRIPNEAFVNEVANSVASTKASLDNATFTGLVKLQQTSDKVITKTGATGVVTYDFSEAAAWYHTGILSNFVANFINISETTGYNTIATLLLAQGSTPYLPTEVRIDGSPYGIKWLNAEIPVSNANSVDIVSFSFFKPQYESATWIIFASLTQYA